MDKIAARAEQAIAETVFPGCVIGIIQNGESIVQPYGDLIYQVADPVMEDTVYDLASITKSIPLAALAALLISDGKFKLTDLVRSYVTDIEYDYDATVEDLLRYRVKGTQLSTLAYGTFEEIRAHAIERGFDGPPGSFQYTNLPAFILGIIIERVTGSSLPALAHKHFFEPLGMDRTTFFPAARDCAPTEIIEGVEIRGIVHDESARVFAKARRAAGHAGLFSTAGDLLKFAAHMIEHPESPVARAAQDGLGWEIIHPNLFGSVAHSGCFGKTGFTGTSIVIDLPRRRAFVILSNRTYPKRSLNHEAIRVFRRDIADIVLSS